MSARATKRRKLSPLAAAATERRNRSLLAAAATAAVFGIAASVTGEARFGAWVTLGGLVLLIYTLHRFGRSGADGETGSGRRRSRRD
jgi:hypothetical protein